MKTKSLFGKKYLDLDIREINLEPGPFDVIVKVLACGVCGTDLNFIRDYEEDFMPLGHEIAGEVVQCGASVTNVSVGDTVTVEDCSMCGNCIDCKSGHPEFCREMFTLNGCPGMGEYVMVNCGNLNVYSGMSPVHACLTEPLAVALAAVNKADIPANGSVMIFGTGPIGLLTAALAKHRGAGFVGISGRSADTVMNRARLALAEKILSPAEKARFEAATDKRRALLTFWVLKEAAAKCSGEGLRGYPNHTDFSPDDPRVTEIDGCLVAIIEE
jgi:threonine dehydrogenase-like Zn-dependent dehydrogenase